MREVVFIRYARHGVEYHPNVTHNGRSERATLCGSQATEQATGCMPQRRRIAQEANALSNIKDTLT